MFAETTYIELVSVDTYTSKLVMFHLLLDVGLHADPSSSLVSRRVEPRGNHLVARLNFDVSGEIAEVIWLQLHHHFPSTLLQHHISLHIIFCYFSHSSVLCPFSTVNEVYPQPCVFLLMRGCVPCKWVHQSFASLWAVLMVVSGDAVNSNVLLI